MNRIARDDRVLPETRVVSALIVPFLIAGFVILYLFPDDTGRLFAWTIEPSMTPQVMGAGYFAGAYFFARAVFASRWHEVGLGFLPTAVFTYPMALATFFHWDKFNHDHVSFWIWTALYILTPFLVPLLWLRNRSTDPQTPDRSEILVPRPVRWVMGVIGAVELLLGLIMFLWPDLLIPLWPWTLTPLTARILAGWFALPGVGGLVVALEPRWSASRIALEGAIIWSALVLIGIARAWDDFDQTNPLTWVYVGAFGLTLFGISVLHIVLETSHRRAKARTAADNGDNDEY